MNALVTSKLAGVIAVLLGLAAAIWLVAAEIRSVPSATLALAMVACLSAPSWLRGPKTT